jgi:hypothetical protein
MYICNFVNILGHKRHFTRQPFDLTSNLDEMVDIAKNRKIVTLNLTFLKFEYDCKNDKILEVVSEVFQFFFFKKINSY